MLALPGPALPLCSGEGQGQLIHSHTCPWRWLTHVHSTRASSTVLPMRGVGPALLSATASDGEGQFCTALGHQHGPRQPSRPGEIQWPLVMTWAKDTDPSGHRPRHSPWRLHWQDFPWPPVAAQAAQVRLLLTTLASLVPRLFIDHELIHFSFHDLYRVHLLIVAAPSLPERHGCR